MVTRPPKPLDTRSQVVFERLRAWRLQRSRDDQVPAFVVAHDRTLIGIARDRPTSPAMLLAIHEIGPVKLERYGKDILDVLRGGESS